MIKNSKKYKKLIEYVKSVLLFYSVTVHCNLLAYHAYTTHVYVTCVTSFTRVDVRKRALFFL